MTEDNKPEVVVALYKPRDGKFDALKAVLKSHVPTLQRLGMATARAPVYLRAGDGSVIEIFEWSDAAQAHRAHTHPEVAEIWERVGGCAEIITLGQLSEAARPFPHFQAFAV